MMVSFRLQVRQAIYKTLSRRPPLTAFPPVILCYTPLAMKPKLLITEKSQRKSPEARYPPLRRPQPRTVLQD
ncbi:hypothetical protein L6452_25135 [Arctium lappa]|uniref:Uncharacterized protein n=1 Tax=Arctium lappa TaxID=4217 RepID=A0ACB9AAW3_ARCLA|nr:hypothetical protein L6452_25135 [Arctium lappa]